MIAWYGIYSVNILKSQFDVINSIVVVTPRVCSTDPFLEWTLDITSYVVLACVFTSRNLVEISWTLVRVRVCSVWTLIIRIFSSELPTNAKIHSDRKKMWTRVLFIMPNWPVRDQWEYLKKIDWHFPIKPSQPVGMALVIFYSISKFPIIRTKNHLVKDGATNLK